MSLQDGQVDDDDRHDAEDHVRPGNAGDICRSDIELGWCAGPGLVSLLRRAWSSPSTTAGGKGIGT